MPSAAPQRQLAHLLIPSTSDRLFTYSSDRPTAYHISQVPLCWGSHDMLGAAASGECASSKQCFRCEDSHPGSWRACSGTQSGNNFLRCE